MATAALKIRKKPVPYIIEVVRAVVGKMTLNPNFLNPAPSLASITVQVNKLELAFENAIKGGKDQTALVRIEKKQMLFLMNLLTFYIQYTSGGNETKIRSAGYDIKNPSSPVGLLPAPGNVRCVYGKHPREIDVKWNAVAKRRYYHVEISETPLDENSWKDVPGSSKGKLRLTVGNLVPGKEYWFRVFTHSTAGVSGPSDISNHRAT